MTPEIIYQDRLLYPKIIWQRPLHYYKSEAGKIMVLASSSSMTGLAILTCESIFRSGTGIILLGYPKSLRYIYKDFMPEAMLLELPETPSHSIARSAKNDILANAKSCDVLVIGSGLSQNAETIQLIWEVISEAEKPIVLDTDGIKALSTAIKVIRSKESEKYLTDYFKNIKSKLVLILDPKEASKLCLSIGLEKKYTGKYIIENKREIAPLLANILGCIIILNDAEAIVSDGDKTIVNKIIKQNALPNNSNNILSGIVGSFLGQNPNNYLEAITTATYLFDMAIKIARENGNDKEVLASDIIRYLPHAIKIAENE